VIHQLGAGRNEIKRANLKLTRMVKAVEIGLHLDGVIEILQELSLKCDDLLNITKQRVDLRVR